MFFQRIPPADFEFGVGSGLFCSDMLFSVHKGPNCEHCFYEYIPVIINIHWFLYYQSIIFDGVGWAMLVRGRTDMYWYQFLYFTIRLDPHKNQIPCWYIRVPWGRRTDHTSLLPVSMSR